MPKTIANEIYISRRSLVFIHNSKKYSLKKTSTKQKKNLKINSFLFKNLMRYR